MCEIVEADWTRFALPALITPAYPKVAPPSRHNNRQSCTRTQGARRYVPIRAIRGAKPDCGTYRSGGRLVEEGGAVNSGKYGVISIIWIVVYSFVNKIVWDYFWPSPAHPTEPTYWMMWLFFRCFDSLCV